MSGSGSLTELVTTAMWLSSWRRPRKPCGRIFGRNRPLARPPLSTSLLQWLVSSKNMGTVADLTMAMTMPTTMDMSTAKTRFGIHTFTYEQRRPFSCERLQAVLDAWPLPAENKRTFSLQDLCPLEGADRGSVE